MNTPNEGGRSGAAVARLPVWSRITGVLFFVGTAILFARLIWEETVWTWERGPQMVGFSLAHNTGAILFAFPLVLIIWTTSLIALTVWNLTKKKRISRTRWVALGRMAASPRAGDLLLYAAYRGDAGTVQGLVSHGVPVNATDRASWRTALHGAAAKGDTQTVRYLISKGANVNAVDRFGDSPLELAASNNQDATANLLVELGAKRIKGTEAQREKAIDDQVQEQIHGSRNR
jgi:hypothetical protein